MLGHRRMQYDNTTITKAIQHMLESPRISPWAGIEDTNCFLSFKLSTHGNWGDNIYVVIRILWAAVRATAVILHHHAKEEGILLNVSTHTTALPQYCGKSERVNQHIVNETGKFLFYRHWRALDSVRFVITTTVEGGGLQKRLSLQACSMWFVRKPLSLTHTLWLPRLMWFK